MLPNALASYYIKRGWNVWITDFGIKFGFKPGHTHTHTHTINKFNVCVFLQREKIYENNSFGCLLEQPIRATEHQAGTLLYQQAVSNKVKNVCLGFSFLLYFRMQFIIESKTHQIFMCGNVFASESISFNGSNWSYFRHYFRNNENMAV